MGDEAQALEDQGAAEWAWEQAERRYLEEGKWCTKDGRVLPIKDMADRHLFNTIKMIRREMPYYEQEGIDDVRRDQLVALEAEREYRIAKKRERRDHY